MSAGPAVRTLATPTRAPTTSAFSSEKDSNRLSQIEDAIVQIYLQNSSKLSFQSLYTLGYHLVLQKQGEQLYACVEGVITRQIHKDKEMVQSVSDDAFLQRLLDVWERHRIALKMVHDILMYMDKHYVTEHRKLSIVALGIKLFGDHLLKEREVIERFRELTLNLIHLERRKENLPSHILLKSLTNMMIAVDRKEVYEPLLETPYLAASSEFYKHDAEQAIVLRSVPDYLTHVFERLQEEIDRAERSLDSATILKIEEIVKKCLIVQYKEVLLTKESSGCVHLLREWRLDDLHRLYKCLSLVNDTARMIELIKESLLQNGRSIILSNGPPTQIIEELIGLDEKYNTLLHTSFVTIEGGERRIDRACEAALQKAFEDIMNSKECVPEFLALFLDNKIRNRRAGDDVDFEAVCCKSLYLFKQLKNKDVFERYYKIHMARRLLGSKVVSEETERVFISKLKQEFGFAFTCKMEGMFQDQRNAAEVMETFRRKNEQQQLQLPIDFYVSVLTTGYWPIANPTCSIIFPKEFKTCIDSFTRFYLSSHSGRKLTFHDALGSAELRMTSGGKKYELSVSLPQMAVLYCFNQSDALTLEHISQQSGLHTKDIIHAVGSLVVNTPSHARLLSSSAPAATMDDTTVLTINPDFRSKHIKLKFHVAVQQEKEEEVRETKAKINEDRKWIIESVVVRIMKSRRTMEHRNLVCEAIEMLQTKFVPSPEEIKRRIESLIERDYLERVPDSRTRYNYIA